MRKIKRISFKAFLDLKELFENFKRKVAKAQSRAKNLRPRAPQQQQSYAKDTSNKETYKHKIKAKVYKERCQLIRLSKDKNKSVIRWLSMPKNTAKSTQPKQNLRAVKQTKRLGLPKVQYTFREISCDVQFLGFVEERSIIHTELFANYVNEHLKRHKLLVHKERRQTDNGSEYCASWSATKPSACHIELEFY